MREVSREAVDHALIMRVVAYSIQEAHLRESDWDARVISEGYIGGDGRSKTRKNPGNKCLKISCQIKFIYGVYYNKIRRFIFAGNLSANIATMPVQCSFKTDYMNEAEANGANEANSGAFSYQLISV